MGRLEEAVNDCNTASTLPGNQDWAVYKLRGQIYMMEMQKFKEAVQQFESLFFQMVDKGISNAYVGPNKDLTLIHFHVYRTCWKNNAQGDTLLEKGKCSPTTVTWLASIPHG